MSALDKITNVSYPIVIAQYKRAEYGVGDEENLHWALTVITSKKHLSGPTFQAVDRTYADERGKVWTLHYAEDASMITGGKCLGGVQIGSVKARKLDFLVDIVRKHDTVAKFEEWNCRDWIMEVVELLMNEGWIDEKRIATTLREGNRREQEVLLVDLRIASQATSAQATSTGKFKPVVQWIDWYVIQIRINMCSALRSFVIGFRHTAPVGYRGASSVILIGRKHS